ncbi:hypothetical protein ACFVOR_37020 [Streptomyces sp. NPDC057837]|uniref:hypothetical protein n=1 Tax=Streptomyces sp. NPDC057837 TaxID=3346260 RepID=UPI00369F0FD9
MDIGRELHALRARLDRIEASARLSHAAIDNTAVEVRDDTGSLRGLLGVQADGTTAVNIVNGPSPPQPTNPIVASVLGGVTASWDGAFVGGATLPLDWQRLEVHASTTSGFTPTPETLQATIETPQGATVVIVTDDPVYVRLLARSTSGTASTPSDQVGPLGPTPVVADDILDGIVTETKLAAGAVTEAKIAANAVGTVALQDAAVLAENLADAAVGVGKIADNAVTGPAIASEAVSAGKLAANSVTAVKISANAVTSAKVAAGAITTDKLTVTGGANILTDPSFSGAYTAALVAGSTFASQDFTAGNGTLDSLKIDATSATAAFRSVALTSVATLPGEQWHLAVDYWVSTDWVGTEISIHARWETSTGAVISYSKVVVTSPVRETWTRITGTVTAPATTARIVPRVESGSATAGTVRFDNATVRPVLGGTQIQDGAITTQKVVAGAIQTAQLDAGAVNADKIASGAVTTAKLDALAVTADKIATNAITAAKIQAGAVDATALAADAITGKTISGGTITGALIQTAASGQRITLNEAGGNKVLVYDATRPVAEISALGLGLVGTGGAKMVLDPNAVYPTLRLTNAAGTNEAVLNVVENTPGSANPGLNTGKFTASGFTDMKWRTFMGEDFAVIERIRDSSNSTVIGGRLDLRHDYAGIAFMDSTDSTRYADIVLTPGLAKTRARAIIQPSIGDANSVLFLQPGPSHTGYILRAWDPDNSTYRFAVDRLGNTDINGILSAGNIAAGRLTITPVANTPTSQNVTGLSLKGTNIRVVACAATTVPGTQVTGVGVTNQSATGFTVWVTRTNNTNTVIEWIAYGV